MQDIFNYGNYHNYWWTPGTHCPDHRPSRPLGPGLKGSRISHQRWEMTGKIGGCLCMPLAASKGLVAPSSLVTGHLFCCTALIYNWKRKKRRRSAVKNRCMVPVCHKDQQNGTRKSVSPSFNRRQGRHWNQHYPPSARDKQSSMATLSHIDLPSLPQTQPWNI